MIIPRKSIKIGDSFFSFLQLHLSETERETGDGDWRYDPSTIPPHDEIIPVSQPLHSNKMYGGMNRVVFL
jgi:hypothetical protein